MRQNRLRRMSPGQSVLAPRRRRSMRFLQFLRALFATHFNRPAADRYLDRVVIQFVVARRTGSFRHDITLRDLPVIPGTRLVGHVCGSSRYQDL